QRRLGVRLSALPGENLGEPSERFWIIRISFEHLTPRTFAAVQLSSPSNEAREPLLRSGVAGFCQLCVHRFCFIELTIPGQSARVRDRCITIRRMVAEPDLVGSESVTQTAGPRQSLCAVERGIPRALLGGNERIVSRDRRGVVSLPRQCPSKGESSLRVTGLL